MIKCPDKKCTKNWTFCLKIRPKKGFFVKMFKLYKILDKNVHFFVQFLPRHICTIFRYVFLYEKILKKTCPSLYFLKNFKFFFLENKFWDFCREKYLQVIFWRRKLINSSFLKKPRFLKQIFKFWKKNFWFLRKNSYLNSSLLKHNLKFFCPCKNSWFLFLKKKFEVLFFCKQIPNSCFLKVFLSWKKAKFLFLKMKFKVLLPWILSLILGNYIHPTASLVNQKFILSLNESKALMFTQDSFGFFKTSKFSLKYNNVKRNIISCFFFI